MCQVPGCKLSLATEESIPNEDKHFICTFENCGARYSNQFMLDQHSQCHVSKKPAFDTYMERLQIKTKSFEEAHLSE